MWWSFFDLLFSDAALPADEAGAEPDADESLEVPGTIGLLRSLIILGSTFLRRGLLGSAIDLSRSERESPPPPPPPDSFMAGGGGGPPIGGGGGGGGGGGPGILCFLLIRRRLVRS